MLETFYIKAKTIIAETENFSDHCLLVRDGIICEITRSPDTSIQCLDMGNNTIIPGLIDLHIHGREGCDVMDGTAESMDIISSSLAKHGVTGFLATTVTSDWQETLVAMGNIGDACERETSGAKVLGGYSEGLFFTNDHKGAHNEEYFLPLTIDRVDALIDAAFGHLKVIALAPEVDGANDVIRHIRARGVQVMLGHTSATYEQTKDAIDAGACGGVHVFNGMRGIHHREPGCTGAVLMEDTNVEVIADGFHLHPVIMEMICRLKTRDQITLISDCVIAGGMQDGKYKLGKTDVTVLDGVCRTDTGSLAGSTLTLEKAVENMTTMANVEFRDAVHMASLSPAKFLGIDKLTGSIKVGKQADLSIMGADGVIKQTYLQGKTIYEIE